MCQLLGMNCNVPTDICFSFEGFSRRGGATADHGDGWGIAFFEGHGCRLFIDDKPSAESPVADLVKRYPIRSMNVIAHIRKATRGPVALANTHPFQRELWGRYWLFAHNGTLHRFDPPLAGHFRPAGDTDSERAFCVILDALKRRYPHRMPEAGRLYEALAEITCALAYGGTFNYLLSNGEQLFAHCSTDLCYVTRQAPFSVAHLVDQDVTVDFSELTTPEDRVSVIATQPLTDNEQWTRLEPGQLLMFEQGAAQTI
jgi:glutamine amidotransferase